MESKNIIHDRKCYNFFKLAACALIIFFLNVRIEYNNGKIWKISSEHGNQ